MAVLLVSFVVGMVAERYLSLTQPVYNAVVPIVSAAGGPLLWMAAGAVVGALGLTAFHRLREEGLSEIGGGRSKRRSGRI